MECYHLVNTKRCLEAANETAVTSLNRLGWLRLEGVPSGDAWCTLGDVAQCFPMFDM